MKFLQPGNWRRGEADRRKESRGLNCSAPRRNFNLSSTLHCNVSLIAGIASGARGGFQGGGGTDFHRLAKMQNSRVFSRSGIGNVVISGSPCTPVGSGVMKQTSIIGALPQQCFEEPHWASMSVVLLVISADVLTVVILLLAILHWLK